MEQLKSTDLAKLLASDFEIETSVIVKGKLKLPKSYKNIKQFVNGIAKYVIIVDKNGKERPFLNGTERAQLNENDSHLKYEILGQKSFSQVISEALSKGAKIKITDCNICEGGGWYSKGNRYEYKGFYAEL